MSDDIDQLVEQYGEETVRKAFWLQQHIYEEGIKGIGFTGKAEQGMEKIGPFLLKDAIKDEFNDLTFALGQRLFVGGILSILPKSDSIYSTPESGRKRTKTPFQLTKPDSQYSTNNPLQKSVQKLTVS